MIQGQTFFQQANGWDGWSRLFISIGVMSVVMWAAMPVLAVDRDRFDEAYASVEEWMFCA